jgi:hypothetical protein
VINSNAEAKALMSESSMKAKTNQEIFMVVEYDNKTSDTLLRNTIGNTSTPNMEKVPIKTFTDSMDNQDEQTSPELELEETKKAIEETKKKILLMESQISILDNQLNNYGKYSGLYQKKSKGEDILIIYIISLVK